MKTIIYRLNENDQNPYVHKLKPTLMKPELRSNFNDYVQNPYVHKLKSMQTKNIDQNMLSLKLPKIEHTVGGSECLVDTLN